MNINVIKHCKLLYLKDLKNFKLSDSEFKKFYSSYIEVVKASIETVYIKCLSLFRANYKMKTVEYVKDI